MEIHMNHFSIEASKALKALGVEEETDMRFCGDGVHFYDEKIPPVILYRIQRTEYPRLWDEGIPAYQLHDILKMFSQITDAIAKKKGWDDSTKDDLAAVLKESLTMLPWSYEEAEKQLLMHLTT